MIITKKQLAEIEEFIGHSCEAGVLAEQGGIAIRVWGNKPNGQKFSCQQAFLIEEYMERRGWTPAIERFKHWAKRDFDLAFSS